MPFHSSVGHHFQTYPAPFYGKLGAISYQKNVGENRKYMKFRVTRHWLELASRWLKMTRQFSWLDSDSTRLSHESDFDSTRKNFGWLWLEGPVTLTRQKWLGLISANLRSKIQKFLWMFLVMRAQAETKKFTLWEFQSWKTERQPIMFCFSKTSIIVLSKICQDFCHVNFKKYRENFFSWDVFFFFRGKFIKTCWIL